MTRVAMQSFASSLEGLRVSAPGVCSDPVTDRVSLVGADEHPGLQGYSFATTC